MATEDKSAPVVATPTGRGFIVTMGNEAISVSLSDLERLVHSPVNTFDHILSNAALAVRIEFEAASIPLRGGQDIMDNFTLVQNTIQGRTFKGFWTAWGNESLRVSLSRDMMTFNWRSETTPVSVWKFYELSLRNNFFRILSNIACSLGIEALPVKTDPQVSTAFTFVRARTYKR